MTVMMVIMVIMVMVAIMVMMVMVAIMVMMVMVAIMVMMVMVAIMVMERRKNIHGIGTQCRIVLNEMFFQIKINGTCVIQTDKTKLNTT